MTRLTSLLWSVVALLLICLGTSWAIQRRSVAKAEAAELQAMESKGERDAAIKRGKAKDAEIAIHAQTITALTSEVSKAKAVAAILRAGSSAHPSVSTPSVPSGGGEDTGNLGALVASLDAVIDSQDLLIAEQGAQIKTQDERIKTGDVALAASMRQTRALEIALDAQKHATSSSKWMGRLQGLAIGIAGGYIGGRLK